MLQKQLNQKAETRDVSTIWLLMPDIAWSRAFFMQLCRSEIQTSRKSQQNRELIKLPWKPGWGMEIVALASPGWGGVAWIAKVDSILPTMDGGLPAPVKSSAIQPSARSRPLESNLDNTNRAVLNQGLKRYSYCPTQLKLKQVLVWFTHPPTSSAAKLVS